MAEKSIAYKILIKENTKKSVTADRYTNGKKRKMPIYKAYNDSPLSVAEACRTVAYDLLTQADSIEHNDDFYHEINMEEQIEKMLYENKATWEE